MENMNLQKMYLIEIRLSKFFPQYQSSIQSKYSSESQISTVLDITDILINGLEQITITENEVEDILLKILDTSKAIGPDLLNRRLLKEAASMLKYPLCRLFNLSLTLSTFPSEWKYTNVIPVLKKDCPSNLKNYRPISLISMLAKVMERLIYKHMYNYLMTIT